MLNHPEYETRPRPQLSSRSTVGSTSSSTWRAVPSRRRFRNCWAAWAFLAAACFISSQTCCRGTFWSVIQRPSGTASERRSLRSQGRCEAVYRRSGHAVPAPAQPGGQRNLRVLCPGRGLGRGGRFRDQHAGAVVHDEGRHECAALCRFRGQNCAVGAAFGGAQPISERASRSRL